MCPLISLGRRGRQVLRKTLQCNFARARRSFLRRIGRILNKGTLQNVCAFLPRLLPFPFFDCSLELKPDSVDHNRREAQLVPIQLPLLEELVEKRSAVAVALSIARDEAAHFSFFLDR